MSNEISILLVENFIKLIHDQKENKYSKSLKLAINLAKINKQKDSTKKLEYIKNNTTKQINENLRIVEEIYEKNKHKPLNRTLNLFKKQYHLFEIIKELDEAHNQMLEEVIKISDKLKLKITMNLKEYGL